MSNKWKTMPCKDCLIKKSCTKYCFELPSWRELNDYIFENDIPPTLCLRCGSVSYETFKCCGPGYTVSIKKNKRRP